MADWLSKHLDETTQQFLERDNDDDLRAKT